MTASKDPFPKSGIRDRASRILGDETDRLNPAQIRTSEESRTSRLESFGGGLAVFASAFCFYFSTVVIRWSQAEVSIEPSFFVFVRFLLGFFVVCILMAARRQLPRPRRYHLLLGRTIGNCVAVYCFYNAVKYTSVAEANILNMTYPVFVAVISWVLLRQQRDPVATAMVVVAFVGIWLILAPERVAFKTANLWGLASGVSASAAIVYLNVSRRYHDTNTVLFFMFGIGAVIMLAAFHDHFFWPEGAALRYLLLCAATGIAGQFLLTLGFRYVTAMEGSIISSMRILLAGLLGPFLVGEDALGVAGWIGGLLLFGANTVLSVRHARGKDPEQEMKK
ncbi:MAG: DMT family transporter [Desulfobacterales bacterium]|jgi:drug/metabolite transporter (DMT)-like permease